MKKILTFVLALLLVVVLLFSSTKAYTVSTSMEDLETKILDYYEVDGQFNYQEKDLFGFLPTKSYYDNLTCTLTEGGLDLSLTYHKKILFDFKFDLVSHFELKDDRLIPSGIKFFILELPSFLEGMFYENLTKLEVDITKLPLDLIYSEDGSFYKVSKKDNELVIDFERNSVDDSAYKEKVNSDLLVIENNEIRVSDFNHFVNNKYFLETLKDNHNISKIYLDGDKLYLRIFKDAYEVDYILEGNFKVDNGISFEYFDIYCGEKRLTKDEIKSFMVDNHFKFSAFKDTLYFETKVLEEFVNKYTSVPVKVTKISLADNGDVIIGLKK